VFVRDLPRAESEAAMTLGRRMQLLSCHASRNIPQVRREELLDMLEGFLVENQLSDPEERFWILFAGAAMWLEEYGEQLQAEIGGEILESAMLGEQGKKKA
jgi:hypothetical protein